jgi:phosphoribosylanthranilate isomerase
VAKIKICGLFREEDIDYVNEARPDFIGFVFAASRRWVSAETACRLRNRLDRGIVPVGVFVRTDIDKIVWLYRIGVIEAAQLHGGEDDEYITELKRRCGIPIIQAIFMDSRKNADLGYCVRSDYLLLDSTAGGSGKTFDWDRIGVPEKPYFLAGGVCLENIDRALAQKPYAVDIASGAETDGVKDLAKIKALVRSVRA